MNLTVVNITEAAQRLAARMSENPSGIPVKIGWDGQRIAVFSGTYATPAKSLPNESLRVDYGLQPSEIETLLLLAVARVRARLGKALANRGSERRPRQCHVWRHGAVDRHKPGA